MKLNRTRVAVIGIAALVVAALVVSPAVGGPSLRKLVKKEVSKQISKAIGPQGAQGPAGASGSPDSGGQILTKLASADGEGSGLDADQLDGRDSNAFGSGIVSINFNPPDGGAFSVNPFTNSVGSHTDALIPADVRIGAGIVRIDDPPTTFSSGYDIAIRDDGAVVTQCTIEGTATQCSLGNIPQTIAAGSELDVFVQPFNNPNFADELQVAFRLIPA